MISRVLIVVLTILALLPVLQADLDREVLIKGKKLSAQDVLSQAETQAEVIFFFPFEDAFDHRDDYNHRVTLHDVIREFIDYHKRYNQQDYELVPRSHGRYIFKKKESAQIRMSQELDLNFIEPLDETGVEEKATAQPAGGTFAGNLDVEVISREHNMGDSYTSHFGLKDPKTSTKDMARREASNEVEQDVEAVEENEPGKGRLSAVGTGELSKSGFSTMPLQGLLTGFMAPPLLPGSTLSENQRLLATRLTWQNEEQDAFSTRYFGKLDSELVTLRLDGRMWVMDRLEAMLEVPLGVHTGDFRVAGLRRSDLDFSLGDVTVGFNLDTGYSVFPSTALMVGGRLKVPTGSADSFMGTENHDIGVYGAFQYHSGPLFSFLQIGATYYGDNENYSSLDTQAAFSASTGVEYVVMADISVNGALVYSQSPVESASGLPGYLEDDLFHLQVGAFTRLLAHRFGLELQGGLSDTTPDIGASLTWQLLFD